MPKQKTMLCLGDSYSIGQSVTEAKRFPEQTLAMLASKGINFSKPDFIAQTGWTTTELLMEVESKKPNTNYDAVTLLIGVNDQYSGFDTATYAINFESLLVKAINLANLKNNHVFVLSIPDYSVTPFAQNAQKPTGQIATEIELFNQINKRIAIKHQVHYIDVTPISKLSANDTELLAKDKLHPSGKMYALWATELAAAMQQVY